MSTNLRSVDFWVQPLGGMHIFLHDVDGHFVTVPNREARLNFLVAPSASWGTIQCAPEFDLGSVKLDDVSQLAPVLRSSGRLR